MNDGAPIVSTTAETPIVACTIAHDGDASGKLALVARSGLPAVEIIPLGDRGGGTYEGVTPSRYTGHGTEPVAAVAVWLVRGLEARHVALD